MLCLHEIKLNCGWQLRIYFSRSFYLLDDGYQWWWIRWYTLQIRLDDLHVRNSRISMTSNVNLYRWTTRLWRWDLASIVNVMDGKFWIIRLNTKSNGNVLTLLLDSHSDFLSFFHSFHHVKRTATDTQKKTKQTNSLPEVIIQQKYKPLDSRLAAAKNHSFVTSSQWQWLLLKKIARTTKQKHPWAGANKQTNIYMCPCRHEIENHRLPHDHILCCWAASQAFSHACVSECVHVCNVHVSICFHNVFQSQCSLSRYVIEQPLLLGFLRVAAIDWLAH